MRGARLAGALMVLLVACTGSEEPASSRSLATVYYFDSDALRPVQRELRPGEGLDAVVQALLEPPPENLSSALSDIVISGVTVEGSVITVAVDDDFVAGTDEDIARRAAQVVYGLTAPDPEAAITFVTVSGPLTVVAGDGSDVQAPAQRTDYERFRPWLEVLEPTSGEALVTNSIRVALEMRTETDVRVRLEASDRKYFDVVRSGAGIISVPSDVVLVGSGTMTFTALQDGVERTLEIPVTFNPPGS
ncbi:MAG: GerMN domain-containing protein [Actinobacteria bacterium]|nr:GerMN domain-containing protein [Actinomycetota bacterium]